MRRLSAGVLLCLIASCTGTPPARAPKSHVASIPLPTATASPLRVGNVAPPVVRLFAGTQSTIGTPLRYCFKGECVQGKSLPARLPVDAGALVTIALGRTPERAVADLSGSGGGRQVLAPATLMAVPGRILAGAHRVTLSLSWSDASGTWAFDLLAK